MTLKDKLNIVAQATSALKQAEANLGAAVSALGTAKAADDAALGEGQAIEFSEDNSVFAVRDGQIIKFALVPTSPSP